MDDVQQFGMYGVAQLKEKTFAGKHLLDSVWICWNNCEDLGFKLALL